MQFPCPGCGEQLPLSDELMGKKIRCGGCQRVIELPVKLADDANAADASPVVATAKLIEVPEPTKAASIPASPQPAANVPTMLVDCSCGNRSSVPTSSSGSEVRCPSCQRMMRIPNPPAQGTDRFLSGGAFPTAPVGLPSTSAPTASLDQPTTVNPYRVKQPQTPANNTPIILTAVGCLFALLLVIGTAVLIDGFSEEPKIEAEAAAVEEAASDEVSLMATKRIAFQEGYSMLLPAGYEPLSREKTDRGYIVYRFRRGLGLRLTVAIIISKQYDRGSDLPKKIAEASLKGVSELSFEDDIDIAPMPHIVGRMRAALFNYYEKRVYANRPFFTYTLVVLDEGRKLVMQFDGLYGNNENLSPPDHWRDSLLTLRREKDLKDADAQLVLSSTNEEPESKDTSATSTLTMLDAGYSIKVPKDFKPIKRNYYRGGETRYEFRAPTGMLLIRVKLSPQSNRRSVPPVVLEAPPSNAGDAIVEMGGRYYFKKENVETLILDGMTSSLCRVDHPLDSPPNTSERGYFLIAMDEQKVIFLEMTGKLRENAPESWRECATSIRHADVKKSQMPAAFQTE